jgi:transposase-like protein
MASKIAYPKTLSEAIRLYADPLIAHDFVVALRWPNGVACPRYGCGSADVHFISTRRTWRCNECKRQFSTKVGTIFEESPLGYDKWLPAVWLITNAKNGISSCEIARALAVTQKTAWFMLHRIRAAMASGTFAKFAGPVEVDETYVGGLVKSMNAKRKANLQVRGPGGKGKAAVLGIRERNTAERKGKIRAFVLPFVDRENLQGRIRKHVEPGTEVHTDGHPGYRGLSPEYVHHVIDHAYEYVRENVHTNSIESFFSVLKRTIKGTYIAPRPFHLQAYIEEQVHRFNDREKTDGERFPVVVKQSDGVRLTYKALTRKDTPTKDATTEPTPADDTEWPVPF